MNVARLICSNIFFKNTACRKLSNYSIKSTIKNNFLISTTIKCQPTKLNNFWIWKEGDCIQSPTQQNTVKLPTLIWVPKPILPTITEYIEAPPRKPDDVIEAARLIVIRKRKMKKHKLKKLRKRMKFEHAKVRQRRELRKEKAFQAQLIAQIKEAEKFSAEQYVAEKIKKATEKPLPRFWKGKRLPAFIIRQKLGLDKTT